MMALMLRKAIYSFDVCLIASLLRRARELLFWRSQAGVPQKTLGFDRALGPRKFCEKFLGVASNGQWRRMGYYWRSGRTTMDACIVLAVASLAIAFLLGSAAFAQTPSASTNTVVTINTANKFQQVLASSGTPRRMLRISNNNNYRDSCWVFVGSGQASKEGSYEVGSGKEYLRYPPFVSSDAIQATCASSSDTLDVEYQ